MNIENKFKPMSLGEVLDYTFNIYRKNFLKLIVVFGLLSFPLDIISSIIDNSSSLVNKIMKIMENNFNNPKAAMEAFNKLMSANEAASVNPWVNIISVLSIIALIIYLPALYKMVSEAFKGNSITVEDSYKYSFKRFFSYVGALMLFVLITFFVTVVVTIALVIAFAILYLISNLVGPLRVVIIIISMIALIFITIMFSFYLYATFSFMTVSLVAEEKSPMEAIKRGFSLAQFKLFRFTGVTILMSLIIGIPSLIIQQIGLAISRATGIDMIQHIIFAGTGVVLNPIMFVLVIVLYYDYKIRREGIDIEQAYSELQ